MGLLDLRKQKAALIGLYIIFHNDKGIRKKIRQIDKEIRKELQNGNNSN